MPRVVGKVIHKRTRSERKAARQGLDLRNAGVTDKTRAAYFVALCLLLPFIENVKNEAELDLACSEWVALCWEDGESLYTVGNALSGLHFFEPFTKRKIPSAWKLFANWKKMEWPARAPPLTSDIVLSLAHYALSHNDPFFCCLLTLGFFTLLRTGELLQLKGQDLLVNSKRLVVSLKDTKTGKRNAADEMVTTDHASTVMVAQTIREILASHNLLHCKLWAFSGQAFRNRFDSYIRRFHLQSFAFRPYSLRRGGATWIVQSTGSMELALLKGRWASHRVARIYIADGLSKLPDILLSERSRHLLDFWHPRRLSSAAKGVRGSAHK